MSVVYIVSLKVPICAFHKAQVAFSYCLTQWNCGKHFLKVRVTILFFSICCCQCSLLKHKHCYDLHFRFCACSPCQGDNSFMLVTAAPHKEWKLVLCYCLVYGYLGRGGGRKCVMSVKSVKITSRMGKKYPLEKECWTRFPVCHSLLKVSCEWGGDSGTNATEVLRSSQGRCCDPQYHNDDDRRTNRVGFIIFPWHHFGKSCPKAKKPRGGLS